MGALCRALAPIFVSANEKPPAGTGGLTGQRGSPYAVIAYLAHRGRYWITPVKSTPMRSGTLDGATTRRNPLNLDRGGQPQDAQRIAGKREWHRETGKSSPQRDGSDSHPNPHDLDLGVFRLDPCGNHQQSSALHQFLTSGSNPSRIL